MNYLTPKTRREILELLVTGLKRLEYRGYDSAGVAIDSNDGNDIVLVKRSGKVLVLEEAIKQGNSHFHPLSFKFLLSKYFQPLFFFFGFACSL